MKSTFGTEASGQLPVEVHHWAAAEAAAGTDGKPCYEVSADLWEMILYILQHNQVVFKLCKGSEKRPRKNLSLQHRIDGGLASDVQ